MELCLRLLKESNKSEFDSYIVRKSVSIISHITFWVCRMHTFSDNFLKIAVFGIIQSVEAFMSRHLRDVKKVSVQ